MNSVFVLLILATFVGFCEIDFESVKTFDRCLTLNPER